MDQETILFLKRIAESIGLILIWMLFNVFFGLYKKYAFFENIPVWQNILYYVLSITTAIFVYVHIVKKWKTK
jgi:hypothetical protein